MLRSAWVVLPVSEWMVVGYKEVTLAGRAKVFWALGRLETQKG